MLVELMLLALNLFHNHRIIHPNSFFCHSTIFRKIWRILTKFLSHLDRMNDLLTLFEQKQ